MNWFDEAFDRGLEASDVLSPDEIVDPASAPPIEIAAIASGPPIELEDFESGPRAEIDEPVTPRARDLGSSWSLETDSRCTSVDDADGTDQDDEERQGRYDPDTGLSYDGARRVYALLCAMAHVDGRVVPAQRRELEEYQEFLGLSTFAANVLEDEARRSRTLRLGLRQAELDLLMSALIDMAAADGRISAKEERLLERVNERAGWSGDAIAGAVARALERARSVQPVREPDPAPQRPEPRAPHGLASVDDPFGFTVNRPALDLEDSDDGELVIPGARPTSPEPVLPDPPPSVRQRSRSASASLAALASSDSDLAPPAKPAARAARPARSSRAKKAPAPRRRRAGTWR